LDEITAYGVVYRRFDHLYFISADGRAMRLLSRVSPHQHGPYLAYGRQRLAHRMVAKCWLPKPNERARHIHHINGIKTDNRAENLMWVTPQEHMGDHHEGLSRGHKMSEAGKQRLRELRLGSKASEATRRKQRRVAIRLGSKPPMRPKGYKCSEAMLEKMRQNSPNKVACEVDGVIYRSFSQAGAALGLRPHTLRKRCLSANFPNYKLKD